MSSAITGSNISKAARQGVEVKSFKQSFDSALPRLFSAANPKKVVDDKPVDPNAPFADIDPVAVERQDKIRFEPNHAVEQRDIGGESTAFKKDTPFGDIPKPTPSVTLSDSGSLPTQFGDASGQAKDGTIEPVEIRGRLSPSLTKTQFDRPGPKGYISNYASRSPSTPIEQLVPNPDEAGHVGAFAELPESVVRPIPQDFETSQVGQRFDEAFKDESRQTRVRRELADPSLGLILNEATSSINVFSARGRSAAAGFVFREDTNSADSISHLDRQSFTASLAPRKPRQEPLRLKKKVNVGYSDHDPKLSESPFDATRVVEGDQEWFPGNQSTSPQGQIPKPADISLTAHPELVQRNVQTVTQDITTKGYTDDLTVDDLRMPDGSLAKAIVRIPIPVLSQSSVQTADVDDIDNTANLGYAGRADSRFVRTANDSLGYDSWEGSMFMSSALRDTNEFDNILGDGDKVTGVAGTGFLYYSPTKRAWVEKRADAATSLGENSRRAEVSGSVNALEVNTEAYETSDSVIPPQYMSEGVYNPEAIGSPNVTSIQIPTPAGTERNDLLVCFITARANANNMSITHPGDPGGWVLVERVNSLSTNETIVYCAYKIAGPAEPPNYTWNFTGSVPATVNPVGRIIRIAKGTYSPTNPIAYVDTKRKFEVDGSSPTSFNFMDRERLESNAFSLPFKSLRLSVVAYTKTSASSGYMSTVDCNLEATRLSNIFISNNTQTTGTAQFARHTILDASSIIIAEDILFALPLVAATSLATIDIIINPNIITANQPILAINPNGDGGFENGSTFEENGWTVANGGQNNIWYVDSPGAFQGLRGAYISGEVNGGEGASANFDYGIPFDTSRAYFYKDIQVPASATSACLKFKIRGGGLYNFGGNASTAVIPGDVRITTTNIQPIPGVPLPFQAFYAIRNAGNKTDDQFLTRSFVFYTIPGSTIRVIFSSIIFFDLGNDALQPAVSFDSISLEFYNALDIAKFPALEQISIINNLPFESKQIASFNKDKPIYLIDPEKEGSFALGDGSFVANGWLVANGSETNKWHAANNFEGNPFAAAYISNDGGITNAYSKGSGNNSIVHLYRPVNLSTVDGDIKISVTVRVEGGLSPINDNVFISFASKLITPTAGSFVGGFGFGPFVQIAEKGPDFVVIEGTISFQNFINFALDIGPGINVLDSWFVITWRNGETGSPNNPPAAITNISLELLSSDNHFISPLQVTGSNEILAQFAASPQLGYLLPYKEHLERLGYDAIGTPTVTYGAPFAPKYHGFQDETIKMSDFIDRPFRVKKVIVKAPVEVQRRHDIEDTGYTLEYPGQDWTRNVTARKDIDNYTFFLYRQRRVGEQIAPLDSIEDRESSTRYLIASASVCVYNSSSFGLAENDGFMDQFGTGTPIIDGTLANTVEQRFFESNAQSEYAEFIPLIDPTGDGGFEDGTSNLVGGNGTFVVNGWTFVNGTQPNKWYIGPAGANGGLRGAYISNDGGITNAYTITSNTWVHFYRDIEVGANVESLLVNFDIRVQGETPLFDYARFSVGSTATTINAGAVPSGGGVTTIGNYNLLGVNFVNISEEISISGPGIIRVIFSWRNDNSVGTQPPASIDNIEIIAKNSSLTTSRIGPRILSTSETTAEGTSINLPLAPGVQEGDLLVAIVSGRIRTGAVSAGISLPAGWTSYANNGATNTTRVGHRIVFKIAGPSESGPVTFNVTSDHSMVLSARMLRITGHRSASPIVAAASTNSNTSAPLLNQPQTAVNNSDYPRLLIQTLAASFGSLATASSDLGIIRENDLSSTTVSSTVGPATARQIQHVRSKLIAPGTFNPQSQVTLDGTSFEAVRGTYFYVMPAEAPNWEAQCPHQLSVNVPASATILKTEASWTYGHEDGNTSEQASFLRAVGGNDSQVYFGDSPIQNIPVVQGEEVYGDPSEDAFISSISINVPAGTVPGDLLVAIISGRVAGHATPASIIAQQAGWTIIHTSPSNPSETISSAIFAAYRTDASAGGSYGFTRTPAGSFRFTGRLIRITGHNSANPVADSQFDFDDSGSNNDISSLPVNTPPYDSLRLTALTWNAGNAAAITCDLADTSSEEVRLVDAVNTSGAAGARQFVRHMNFRGNMSELYTFSANGRLYVLDILINPADSDNLVGDRTYNLLPADEGIANSLSGSTITYELHPARTNIGTACSISANFIKEWSVKTFFIAPIPNIVYLDGLVTHVTGNMHDPLIRKRLTRVSEPLHSPAVAINAGLDDFSESCRFFGKGNLSLTMYPAIVEGGFPVPTLMYITSSTAYYSTSFYRPTIPGPEDNINVGTNRLFNRYPVTGSFFDLNAQFDEFGDLRPEVEVPRPPITSIVQNFWFGGNRQPAFNTNAFPQTNFEGIEDSVEIGPYVRFRPDDPFFKTAQTAEFLNSFTNPSYDIELGRVGLSVFDAITDPFDTPFALVSDPRGKPFALSANPKGQVAGVFARSNLINFGAAASELEPGLEKEAVLTIGSLSGSSFAELAASLTLGYAPSTPGSSRQELIGYVLTPEDELIIGLDAGVTPPPDIAPLVGVPLPDRQGPDIEIFEFSRASSELIDIIDTESETVSTTIVRDPPGAARPLNEPPAALLNASRTEGGSPIVIPEERVRRNDVLKLPEKIEASPSSKQTKSAGYTNKKGGF